MNKIIEGTECVNNDTCEYADVNVDSAELDDFISYNDDILFASKGGSGLEIEYSEEEYNDENLLVKGYVNCESNGKIVNEVSNDISLGLFSVVFDKIHINKGDIENIWYIELEKDNHVIWSSVIMCDFGETNDRLLNKGFYYLMGDCGNNRIKTNNGELNYVITKDRLENLLMSDGIVGKDRVDAFTSVGLWKSLFLALNYSTYLMKKREILYSSFASDYLSKFNKRKDIIERRMRNSVNEEERIKLIKIINRGIQKLFTGVTECENKGSKITSSCHESGVNNNKMEYAKNLRISYKAPFFWASSIGLLYILEKMGMLDYMLLVIEYISEVIPEVIFEFSKISSDQLTESLNDLNNELLKRISMNYQEYLSDLLSVSKRSISIMNSYLKNDVIVKDEELNIRDEEFEEKKNKLEESNLRNGENNNLNEKKKPNYMKPTMLSEMRRQQSIKSVIEREDKPKERKNAPGDLVKERGTSIMDNGANNIRNFKDAELSGVYKEVNDCHTDGNEENSSDINNSTNKSYIKIQDTNCGSGGNKINDIDENRVKKRSINNCSVNKSLNKETKTEKRLNVLDKSKFREKNDYVNLHENQNIEINGVPVENIDDKMDKLFENNSVLLKKQIERNISNFDDELNSIINEIDKIKIDGVQIIKDIVSTNVSEEGSSHQIMDFLENSTSCNNVIDEDEIKLGVNIDNMVQKNVNQSCEINRLEEGIKSPMMDPYDWYYTSSNNIEKKENREKEEVNIGQRFVEVGKEDEIGQSDGIQAKHNFDLKYIESILDKEIEELQRKESELANDLIQ